MVNYLSLSLYICRMKCLSYKLQYGKFKGMLLKDVPKPYLQAVYNGKNPPTEVKEYCEKVLKIGKEKMSSIEKWVLENKSYTSAIKELGKKIISNV
jgi:uncharacterized protein (DUF3820 family)